MGFLSHKVKRSDLVEGDHIYSYRSLGVKIYAHHGIYVGGGNVVHFGTNGINMSSSLPGAANSGRGSRVVMTSLDEFLGKGSLRRFKYGVSKAYFIGRVKGGTCTTAESDPPQQVIHRAMYLLREGFGKYNPITHNCELFAMYCKTGLVIRGVGFTGQAAFPAVTIPAVGIGMVAAKVIVAAAHVHVSGPVLFVSTCIHISTRYETDFGVRDDVYKVKVENLIAWLEVTR